MKDPEKMVQTGESRLSRDVGDGESSRLQEFLGVANPHPQDLVKDGTAEFLAEGAFQRPARKPGVGDNVVHRQTAPEKVSLNVSQGCVDLGVFDRKDLSAFAGYDSFWRDPLRYLRRRFAINQGVQ